MSDHWPDEGSNAGFDPNEFVLPQFVPTVSATQVESESSAREIAPGEHVLVVNSFVGTIKPEYRKCILDGRETGYNCFSLAIKFVQSDDFGASIVDRFVLPPMDPSEHRAYFEGFEGASKTKGFQARKFVHFLNKLYGTDIQPGSQIPQNMLSLGSWKNRSVVATVVAGKPYTKEDPRTLQTQTFPGRNQVQLFTYRHHDTGAPVSASSFRQPASGNGRAQQQSLGIPAPAPQTGRGPYQSTPPRKSAAQQMSSMDI